MKKTIIYIIGLVMIMYVMIMYDVPYLYTIFWCAVVLWCLCLIQVLFSARQLEVMFEQESFIYTQGDKMKVTVLIKNKMLFPITHIRIKIKYRNNFDEKTMYQMVKVRIDGKSTLKVEIAPFFHYCGLVEAEIGPVYISDYIGLIETAAKGMSKALIYVMPALTSPVDIVDSRKGHTAPDSDSYSTESSGDDPSEVFDVRPYRPGDRLQRIHWKLTARADDFMVKEFSRPEKDSIILFLDFFLESGKVGVVQAMSRVVETAAAVSGGLIQKKYGHWLVWYDQNMRICRCLILQEADLLTSFEAVYRTSPYKYSYDWTKLYYETFQEDNAPRFIMVNMKREVEIDGEKAAVIEKHSFNHKQAGMKVVI